MPRAGSGANASSHLGHLFLTHSLTVWNACILLILHGMAGALWSPPEQLLLEDFVGAGDLPSVARERVSALGAGRKDQVIGVYGVGANGMRIGSGFTVGLFGTMVGLRTALGLSSTALVGCVLALAAYLIVVAKRNRLNTNHLCN